MTVNTFKLNGMDFSDVVNASLYRTEVTPIERKITTLDGVDTIAHVNDRYTLIVGFNPMSDDRYIELCDGLQNSKCTVQFTVLQTGQDVTVQMKYDQKSADFIGRCKFLNKRWISETAITFYGPVR